MNQDNNVHYRICINIGGISSEDENLFGETQNYIVFPRRPELFIIYLPLICIFIIPLAYLSARK